MVVNTKLVATLILGLFALSMAQFTPSPFLCPSKQFYNPDSAETNKCVACSTATDTVCGRSDNTCQFYWYDSATPACNDCTTIANTDSSKVTVDPTACPCQDQYFWSAQSHTCVSCDTSSDATSCNSCNNIYDGTTCKKCSAIDFATGQFDTVNKGCFCKVGYAWSADTFSCVLCSTLTVADSCKVITCPSYFWNALTSTCVQCSSIDNTDPAINNKAYGQETCACFQGFAWDATTNTCVTCASAVDLKTCNSPSCSLYIWSGTACVNDCTTIANYDTNFPVPVNGACKCLRDFFWSSTDNTCTACDGATADNCKLCPSYIFSAQKCSKCSDISNTDILYNPYANKGRCYCIQNFFWDQSTNTCLGCETAPFSLCGFASCSNFYAKTAVDGTKTCEKCYLISNTAPKTNNTAPNACGCSSGYLWVQSTSTCIPCDITKGYILIDATTGTCSNCNAQPNTKRDNDYSNYKNKTCACNANYTLINGQCNCDANKKILDMGKSRGCGACGLIPGALVFSSKTTKDGTKTITTSACSCINGATWDAVNFYCVCADKYYMPITGKTITCTLCPVASTTGSDPTSPYRCICKDEFIWSIPDAKCICLDPNSIILEDNTCFSCLDPLAYSNGTRVSSIACGCPKNNVWNIKTKACVCDNSSVPVNGVCTPCATIQAGATKLTDTTCKCKSPYNWNPVTQNCDCTKASGCICPTNFTLVGTTGNTFCVSCGTIPGSTGASAKIGCACLPGFTWSTTLFKCTCAASMVTDGYKYCITCNISINATAQFTPFSCRCMPNHVWNRITGKCDFITTMANTKNLIMKPSGDFVSCEGLEGSTGVAIDNFNCKCGEGFIWNDLTSACIECSKLANIDVTKPVASDFSCKCATNYTWDVLSYTCIKGTCAAPADAGCGNCALVLGSPAAKLVAIATKDTFVTFSDDWAFAAKVSFNNPGYNKIDKFRCACLSPTSWNRSRKRCYPTAANLIY